MRRGSDSQWQQQKADEASTFGHSSSFAPSSTLDSRHREAPRRARPSRGRSRKPSWLLLLILMIVVVGVALMKVLENQR